MIAKTSRFRKDWRQERRRESEEVEAKLKCEKLLSRCKKDLGIGRDEMSRKTKENVTKIPFITKDSISNEKAVFENHRKSLIQHCDLRAKRATVTF